MNRQSEILENLKEVKEGMGVMNVKKIEILITNAYNEIDNIINTARKEGIEKNPNAKEYVPTLGDCKRRCSEILGYLEDIKKYI